MSTKIFNAWRSTRPIKKAADLFLESERIRSALQPVSRMAFYRVAAMAACDHIDRQMILGERRTCAADYIAEQQAEARKRHIRGERMPDWDTEVSWAFLPTRQNRILLRLYAEEGAVVRAMNHLSNWEDYHFQNSVDRPGNITARQWRQRRRDWDAAMGDGVPATTGLTADLWPQFGGPDVWDGVSILLSHQPTLSTRTKRTARVILEKAYFENHAPPEGSPPHVWADLFRRSREWLRTPEGVQVLGVEAERVRHLLLPRITRDALCYAD